jgi:hypothetical protein
MRARRLASNCAPDQLAHIADVAHEHQRKHIMLCSGSHSRSDCQANCSEHHGTRCWVSGCSMGRVGSSKEPRLFRHHSSSCEALVVVATAVGSGAGSSA